MRMRRSLSLLLAIAMLVSLFTGIPAFAAVGDSIVYTLTVVDDLGTPLEGIEVAIIDTATSGTFDTPQTKIEPSTVTTDESGRATFKITQNRTSASGPSPILSVTSVGDNDVAPKERVNFSFGYAIDTTAPLTQEGANLTLTLNRLTTDLTLDFVGPKGERVRGVKYWVGPSSEIPADELELPTTTFEGDATHTVQATNGVENALWIRSISNGSLYSVADSYRFTFTPGTDKTEGCYSLVGNQLTVSAEYMQVGTASIHYLKFVDEDGEPIELPFSKEEQDPAFSLDIQGLVNGEYVSEYYPVDSENPESGFRGFALGYSPLYEDDGDTSGASYFGVDMYANPENIPLYLWLDTYRFDYAYSPDSYIPLSDGLETVVTLYKSLPYHIQVRDTYGGLLPEGVFATITLTEYASAEDTTGSVLYSGTGNEFNEIFRNLKKGLRYRVDITVPEGYEALDPSYCYFVADGASDLEEGASSSFSIDNDRIDMFGNNWGDVVVTANIAATGTGGDVTEIPEGDGSAVINFVDREEAPIKVTGTYEIERFSDIGSSYEAVGSVNELSSTWNLSDLEDGTYRVKLTGGESEAGDYLFDQTELYFVMYNGTLITDGMWGMTPYASLGEVRSYSGNQITLIPAYPRVSVSPILVGNDTPIPFVVTNSDGETVLDHSKPYGFLPPGEYTANLVENDAFAQIINYETARGGVKFTVEEDYWVSPESDQIAVSGDLTFQDIAWMLDPIESMVMTITAEATTTEGLFAMGSALQLTRKEIIDGEEAWIYSHTVELPANTNQYRYTWDLLKKYVSMTEDGDYQAADATYKVSAISSVDWKLVDFVENEDDGIWYGAIPGVAHQHTICGLECFHDGEHPLQDCIPVTQEMVDAGNPFTEDGVYALAEDIVVDETMEISATMNLCLNGYSWTLNRSYENQLAFDFTGDGGTVDCRGFFNILYNEPQATETYTVYIMDSIQFAELQGVTASFTADDQDDQEISVNGESVQIKGGVTYTVTCANIPESFEDLQGTFTVDHNTNDVEANPDSAISVDVAEKNIYLYLDYKEVEYTLKAIHYCTEELGPDFVEEVTGVTVTITDTEDVEQRITIDGSSEAKVSLKYGETYMLHYVSEPEGFETADDEFSIHPTDGSYNSRIKVDLEQKTVTLGVTKGYPEGGTGTVNLKFVDEGGQPIAINAEPEYWQCQQSEDGSLRLLYSIPVPEKNQNGVTECRMTDMADGYWVINMASASNPLYSKENRIEFQMTDGAIEDYWASDCTVTEFDQETNTFTISFLQNRVADAGVPMTEDGKAFIDSVALPYEIKNKDGDVVASTKMDQLKTDEIPDGSPLADGTYTMEVMESPEWEGYFDVPSGLVTFEVENYEVISDYETLAEQSAHTTSYSNNVTAVIGDFTVNADKTLTVTATLNPAEGEAIPENTTVQLWRNTGAGLEKVGEAKSAAASKDPQVFTWENLPAYKDYDEYYLDIERYIVTYTAGEEEDEWFEPVEGSSINFKATLPATEGNEEETYTIDGEWNSESSTVAADKTSAKAGDVVTLTVTPAENYKLNELTVTTATVEAAAVELTETTVEGAAARTFTFTMPASNVTFTAVYSSEGSSGGDPIEPDEPTTDYTINIPKNFTGGTVSASVNGAAATTAKAGDTVTLTATPSTNFALRSISVTDAEGNPVNTVSALAEATQVSFEMPASSVSVDADFAREALESPFTIKAEIDADASATDKNTDDDSSNLDVYADETVVVNVTVNGSSFTNADWTMVYDSSKFELTDTILAENAEAVSVDGENVVAGKIRGAAAETQTDEYADGTVVATYTFKALAQVKDEVTGNFSITAGHANTYTMAGLQDNTPAKELVGTEATIIQVREDDQVPTGSIEPKTVAYNGEQQYGNPYVLEDAFEDAIVTYATAEGGVAVDDPTTLTYRTGLPMWKDVGVYNYYVKVSGDGLATIYDATTLTITKRPILPTVDFDVDPDVNKVTITPILTNVVDDTFSGTVVVKIGEEEIGTYTAADFVYDGDSSAVANIPIEYTTAVGGDLTVDIIYTTGGDTDNYDSGEGEEIVNVDKISADDDTVTSLEEAITNEFPYDGTAHEVELGDLPEGWELVDITNAFTGEETPSVTNVGEDTLAKVVFEDESGKYNDVVIYVVLKVTPAEVTITVDDKEKNIGEDDPDLTYEVTGLITADEEANVLDIQLYRDPGEVAGSYDIHASYVPNVNYNVTVDEGVLTIDAPELGTEVFYEVVDLSLRDGGEAKQDYIAGKRLVLVYTNANKAYYSYDGEVMMDVTDAGYTYIENDYDTTTATTHDDMSFTHVYGIVVDAIDTYEATEEYEAKYTALIQFEGADEAFAPIKVKYDEDINLTGEKDVNDYSMTNGVYNTMYERIAYQQSILKADYNCDKVVNTKDATEVKDEVDPQA